MERDGCVAELERLCRLIVERIIRCRVPNEKIRIELGGDTRMLLRMSRTRRRL